MKDENDPRAPRKGVFVPAGSDRFHRRRSVLGGLDIDVKLSGQDSGGELCLLEHTDQHEGGPPRHLHHEQDEWFYVLEGTYIVDVGADRHELMPGDCVLAPRNVPHAWAHVGRGRGRLIIAFQPAGSMEAFLDELSSVTESPGSERLQELFRAHGMEIVGPPLLTT